MGVHKEETEKAPLDRFDFMAFHAPTCKLVSKSYARLLYNDFLEDPTHPVFKEVAPELSSIIDRQECGEDLHGADQETLYRASTAGHPGCNHVWKHVLWQRVWWPCWFDQQHCSQDNAGQEDRSFQLRQWSDQFHVQLEGGW